MPNIDLLKELRGLTGVSVSECKKALEEAGDDVERAKNLLREWGKEVAEKKSDREVGEGLVAAYVHGNGKIGSLVAVKCETDFVARSEDFQHLCHELALQAASMDAGSAEELLEQEYIRDPSKKVQELVQEAIAKLGENIVVEKIARFQV